MDVGTTPAIDSSMGLIMRLNWLWGKVDLPAAEGHYDEWNAWLDRIYNNIDFDPKTIDAKFDEQGKLVSFSMETQDHKVYQYLSSKIWKAKSKYGGAKKLRKEKEMTQARNDWYQALMDKDRWMRKMMQKLKLYLRITEKNPGTAAFGSFGTKRRR